MHCSQLHSWDILWGDYETPKGKSYFVYRYLHRQMPLIMVICADAYEKRAPVPPSNWDPPGI